MERREFPNLAIVATILKAFCTPFLNTLEKEYATPEDKFEAVRNEASDQGNDEVVAICDYLEREKLIEVFFPN